MRYCEIKRSSPLLFYLLHWIEGTRWNKGFSMIFLLPWWHRCHRMEAFKGILWRYIPTKTIQKGDVSHICPLIPIVAWSMIRFATQLMGYHSQAMRQRIRFPFKCPPKPSLSGGLLAAITIPQLMNGIKRLQFQRAYARAILTVKQTMIIMAEDDWILTINIFLDISLLVGGFNHLEKYESQWE